MLKKYFITSLVLLSSLMASPSVWAGCAIESSPIPEIARYSQSVDARIAELLKTSRQATCGVSKTGASASAERVADSIDSAFSQVFSFDNTFLDFLYTIKLSVNGESRSPVTRDGLLWNRIEQRITGAMTTSANQCGLDGAVRTGFQSLLSENSTLENIYKQAALGTVSRDFSWLSRSGAIVADAINTNYNPWATSECQDTTGTAGPIAKITTALEKWGINNEKVWDNWKAALKIFQWGEKGDIEKYNATQRRLLQDELSRQGFSPRSAQAMLGNFDCVKAKTAWQPDDFIATVKARQDCSVIPLAGTDVFMKQWARAFPEPRTTTEYVQKVQAVSRQSTLQRSIVSMDAYLRAMKTPTQEENDTIVLNLIDTHLALVSTIDMLNKRTVKMRTNCMKAQPDIECPKQ